jgi:hypothetical protein
VDGKFSSLAAGNLEKSAISFGSQAQGRLAKQMKDRN